MFSPKISSHLLNIAAMLVGMTVPSLFFGRAFIALFLGLSLILVLMGANHKETWRSLRPLCTHWLCLLIGLCLIGTSLNIPFSLRLDLSLEAWVRTWFLLFTVFYLLYSLRKHLDIVLKSLTLALLGVVILYTVYIYLSIAQNKLVLNGFLLILPISIYQCLKDRKPIWMGIGFITFLLYFICAIERTSKASVAGVILIILSTIIFFGLSRFSLRKTIMLSSSAIMLSVIGLMIWLPGHLNESSSANISAAPFPVWIIDFHRQMIWQFAFDLAHENPWIGLGLNASNYHPLAQQTVLEYFGPEFKNLTDLSNAQVLPAHPHNWMLEVVLDGGLLSFIPLFLSVISIFYLSIKNYFSTQDPALLSLICINVAYWGTGLLNFSFWSVWWQVSYFLSCLLMFVIYHSKLSLLHEK